MKKSLKLELASKVFEKMEKIETLKYGFEQYQVSMFLNALELSKSCLLSRPINDPPDFIIESKTQKIGIELVSFYFDTNKKGSEGAKFYASYFMFFKKLRRALIKNEMGKIYGIIIPKEESKNFIIDLNLKKQEELIKEIVHLLKSISHQNIEKLNVYSFSKEHLYILDTYVHEIIINNYSEFEDEGYFWWVPHLQSGVNNEKLNPYPVLKN